MPDDWKNTLHHGDNLDILRRHIQDESADLVYLDPPFNSNATYNVLFAERNSSRAAAQIKAFEDTWEWNEASARAFDQVIATGPDRVAHAMDAFRRMLGANDLLAYLCMMAPRLVELRRVLKDTGSIYLHCDPTAGHYLKLLMDAIFGSGSFRREIVWRSGWVSGYKAAAKNWIRNHDTLLYYLKNPKSGPTFHLPFRPHPPDYERRGGKENPRGVPLDDVWTDIYSPAIMSLSTEKLGYPTQKPEALLERIIRASSNEGDLVLDPFCGCGTTIVAAQRLNRRWIGIDMTHLAIGLMRHRLRDAFGEKEMRDGAIVPAVEYDVIGEPVSLPDARTLAARDKYQFQWWALGRAGARPAEPEKGADRGIDGRMYFLDEATGAKTKQIVLQVKAGKTGSKDVRDLRGVLEREKAEIGVLITMQEPTSEMRREAASAGFYASPGQGASYPRLQILTVSDLLKGARIGYPPQTNVTFKKAPRARRQDSKQNGLFEETEET